jgi:hypothetical protein
MRSHLCSGPISSHSVASRGVRPPCFGAQIRISARLLAAAVLRSLNESRRNGGFRESIAVMSFALALRRRCALLFKCREEVEFAQLLANRCASRG